MAKILIIDDEADLVNMLKMRLEAAGYDVISAGDGQEGLGIIRKSKPDLVVLDLMLPGMDGYKVCGLLKNDKRYSEIPVIIFSARAQQSDMKMGEEVGADAYITKPFEPKALLDKIEELIKRGRGKKE